MQHKDSAADRVAGEKRLKDDLRAASASFRKKTDRHWLSTKGVIYCAFSTPGFTVYREEAQRDAARRLEQFGIGSGEIEGKRVLDLGCNNGTILFQLSNYRPASGLGIEYDPEKVRLAERIAAYAGISGLEFRVGDIDRLEAEDIGPPFDVVMCLAVEAHVRDPKRLYRLLAKLTRGDLYFEANASTRPDAVRAELSAVGFAEIRHLGTCDDD